MGGIFGVASKTSCVLDLFFGIDYHSHLGTRRGGMAVYDSKKGFDRAIHNIENSPFRTKFDRDVAELEGNFGIGCISDNEPQPLLVRSHLGNFAITTVGKINNMDELIADSFKNGCTHFLEQSGGCVNPTEMVASLINQKSTLVEVFPLKALLILIWAMKMRRNLAREKLCLSPRKAWKRCKNRGQRCVFVRSSGHTMDIRPRPMRGSMWKKCDTSAAICWR